MPSPPPKGDILNEEPTIAILRRLVLDDTPAHQGGPLTPALIAELRKRGVGDDLIRFEKMTEAEKSHYRRPYEGSEAWKLGGSLTRAPFVLGACNLASVGVDGGSPTDDVTLKSSFFDRSLNPPVCVPDTYPDGTPCPPPNLSEEEKKAPFWSRAHAGSMCDSGFCAVDTAVCEEGFGIYESAYGNARADGEKGSSDNATGPISLTQDDGIVYRFQRVNLDPKSQVSLTPGTTDLRDSTMSVKIWKGLSIFGLKVISVFAADTVLHSVPGAKEPKERIAYLPNVTVGEAAVPTVPPPVKVAALVISPPSFKLPKFACGAIDLTDASTFDFAKRCVPARTKVKVVPKPRKSRLKPTSSGAGKGFKNLGKKVGKSIALDGLAGLSDSAAGEETLPGQVDVDMIDPDGAVTLNRYDLPLPLGTCPKVPGFKLVFGKVCFAASP